MTTYDKDVFSKIQEHFRNNGVNIPDFKTFQAMLISRNITLIKVGVRTTLLHGEKPSCYWTELDKNYNYYFNDQLCQSKPSILEILNIRYCKLRDSLQSLLSRLRKKFVKG